MCTEELTREVAKLVVKPSNWPKKFTKEHKIIVLDNLTKELAFNEEYTICTQLQETKQKILSNAK